MPVQITDPTIKMSGVAIAGLELSPAASCWMVCGSDGLLYASENGGPYLPIGSTSNPTDIEIADNTLDAFQVRQGARDYIDVSTLDGAELVTLGANVSAGVLSSSGSNQIELKSVGGASQPGPVFRVTWDPSFTEQVATLGWDRPSSPDGHKWCLQIERDPDLGWRQAEMHFEYSTVDDLVQRRPISATVRLDTHLTKVFLSGQIHFFDETNVSLLMQTALGAMIMQPGTQVLLAGVNVGNPAVISVRDSLATPRAVLFGLGDGSDTMVVQASNGAGGLALRSFDAAVKFSCNDTGIGFFTTAPIAKPTVTGSRADPEQALANALTELANLGLLTNSTTA